jgi:hypothetical protein
MIVFAESHIVNTTLQELTVQGYHCQNLGTVIEMYKNGKKSIYWHNDRKVFFENALPSTDINEPFKVIVAGSRNFNDDEFLESKLDHILQNKKSVEIVCGDCRGADLLGAKYAAKRGYSVKHFPADWDGLGRKAGHVRNEEMAKYAAPDGGCVIFRVRMSLGSTSMFNLAGKYNLKRKIFDIN